MTPHCSKLQSQNSSRSSTPTLQTQTKSRRSTVTPPANVEQELIQLAKSEHALKIEQMKELHSMKMEILQIKRAKAQRKLDHTNRKNSAGTYDMVTEGSESAVRTYYQI